MKSQKSFSAESNDKGTAGYTYTNTRVKAMKARLFRPDEMQKFLKMSLSEIARHMQESEYGREINELSVKYTDANLIEYALNKNLENTFARISAFSQREARGQIRLYLQRYDVINIKTIIRGKANNIPNERILPEIIASGVLSRAFLEKVIRESADVEAVIERFKRTPYYATMKKFSGDLTKMDDELDKLYYNMVIEKAGKELHSYIEKEIFIKNSLNRLRSKKASINVEIIPGEKKMRIPYEEDNIEARVHLRKMLLTDAIKMIHEVKRNIRPVLGYFVAKEREISNIRMLARGKHSGMKEETINNQLVM